jgi:hypothetical protein
MAEPPEKIGPQAHARRQAARDNRTAVDVRLPAVLTEVKSLLDAPADAARPSRAEVEHTLTNGYACALALEGERLRIEDRLRRAYRDELGEASGELRRLSGLLAHADRELAALRSLLSSLRAQALA